MATKYISKINNIRIFIYVFIRTKMTNLILIYFFGEGGGRFLFSNSNLVSLFFIQFIRLVRRYIQPGNASSRIIHGVLNVWLNQPSQSGYQVLTIKKWGRIFGHRHYTKKKLFVRINVDISSVLTNAGRRFLSPYVKHL